jgi:hypothetical protein
MGGFNFVLMCLVQSLIDGFQPGLVQNDWPVTLYNSIKSGDNPSKNVDTPVVRKKNSIRGHGPQLSRSTWVGLVAVLTCQVDSATPVS